MKKILLGLLIVGMGFAQESQECRRARRGQGCIYASRDATTLSMMGWGAIIAAAIATVCILIPNDEASNNVH